MADSTAYIDTTSFYDTTTIIVYDSTGAFDASVANTLVDEFDSFMGPLTSKCSELEGQLSDIKSRITNCKTSPPTVINSMMVNSLDAAYGSSAWATSDALANNITDTINKCSFFASYATEVPKFSEPGKLTDALNAGASTNTTQVVNDVIDEMKKEFPGVPFEELGLGAELDTLAGAPRPSNSIPKTSVTDPAEAASDVIPSGFSEVNIRKTVVSDVAKSLKMMDSMVECTNSIGGSAFADQVDGMTAELDCFYDTVGLHSDPAKSNYGEFDIDKFLLGVDPIKASNIKKGMNLQAKSQGNTQAAVKMGANTLTVESSAMGKTQSDSIAIKKQYMEDNSKTVFVKPDSGSTPARLVEMPAPEPYQPVLVTPGEPPDPPPPKVALAKYVVDQGLFYTKYANNYTDYDPNRSWKPVFMSDAYNHLVWKIIIDLPSPDQLTVDISTYVYSLVHELKEKMIDGVKHNYWAVGGFMSGNLSIRNLTTGRFRPIFRDNFGNVGVTYSDKIPSSEWISDTTIIPALMKEALRQAIKKWPPVTNTEVDRILENIS